MVVSVFVILHFQAVYHKLVCSRYLWPINLTFQGTGLMGSDSNKDKEMQALGGERGRPPRQESAV